MKDRLHVCISASLFAAAIATSSFADDGPSLQLIDDLSVCAARLDVAFDAGHFADGMDTTRLSVKGALTYLLGDKGMNAERRMLIDDMRRSFETDLQRSPMDARLKARDLTVKCRELVYQAEDYRVAKVAAEKEEAERKATQEAELRFKEAQAAQQVALAVEKQHALELARINAETERLKISKGTELEQERMKISLDETKIQAATSIDLSKIQAETDRVGLQKQAEVDMERTKADIEMTKVKSDANVQMAGKMVDIATVQENASVEREKINAAATTEVAKVNAHAISELASAASKAEIAKAGAATEIAKVEASAGGAAAEILAVPRTSDGSGRDNDAQVVMRAALECGGFYQIMLENAPEQQRPGIARFTEEMYGAARGAGASEQMVVEAPVAMRTKMKAVASKGKAQLQKELRTLKERCTTFNELAKL